MLMLGREVTSPADLVYPGLPTPGLEVNSYVEKLKNELVNCHEEARTTLDACVKREKNQFDKRAKKTVFLRADPVYYLDKSPSTAGKSKKLRPVWKGPGIIVRVISPDLVMVKLSYKNYRVFHHDSLKKCNSLPLPSWVQKEVSALTRDQEILYCLCKQPDDGSWYIECSRCKDWFHNRCLQKTRSELEKLREFVCPECVGK